MSTTFRARPRFDLHSHPDAQQHRPPAVGHESSLQEEAPGEFQWYHRTLRGGVGWYPYGPRFRIATAPQGAEGEG
jgi:hypothetical protein